MSGPLIADQVLLALPTHLPAVDYSKVSHPFKPWRRARWGCQTCGLQASNEIHQSHLLPEEK